MRGAVVRGSPLITMLVNDDHLERLTVRELLESLEVLAFKGVAVLKKQAVIESKSECVW